MITHIDIHTVYRAYCKSYFNQNKNQSLQGLMSQRIIARTKRYSSFIQCVLNHCQTFNEHLRHFKLANLLILVTFIIILTLYSTTCVLFLYVYFT